MKKTYNPKNIEQLLYKKWEEKGYFKPNGNTKCKSFCIVIPPPNVTGSLHMGHAFQQTLIDIIIRYQRMQGKNTLWQVGTDHAGIATQMLVERKVACKEGKIRQDYSREDFIQKIWAWQKESKHNISSQMRRLGNSIDWERERFTLDDHMSNAVQEVFIHLYKENLIYRKRSLVNWDPKLCTAISDLEVENRETKGFMWYIRYPLVGDFKTSDNKDYLIVATTRPETLLGDVAIAVHPQDLRYQSLIGKRVKLPLMNREIPIIADKYADINKGSGCVKITPAHDFCDYEVGCRHNLPMIKILSFNGNICEKSEVFNADIYSKSIFIDNIPKILQKMERFKARATIIEILDNLGLLVKIEPHILTVPYGDRSGVIIEPMLTNQWYIHTHPLAAVAIEAVKNGMIKFIPKQYEKMYFSWMQNIQDWCISRQLWWGHRIPAWYDTNGRVYVGKSKEAIYHEYKLTETIELHQDNDVLDTWFSSALWTFSSLGWPDNTDMLRTFHPTNLLISGFDIIFFWIARMIMLTMHFMKDDNGKPQVPFKIVYLTGLIKDEEGQKMSKSKGNVLDPLDMIDGITLQDLLKKRTKDMIKPNLAESIKQRTIKEFPHGIPSSGTDALRLTLASLASTGRDIKWSMKRLEGYRNFCNKLWNASRFVLLNTQNQDCGYNNGIITLSLPDRWIITEFNNTVKHYRKALDVYRFDMAVNILYNFIWNQFCDWYLELSKFIIYNGHEAQIRATRNTLIEVLEMLLRLAHPIIPFITDTIWQNVKVLKNITDDTIMLQSFPEYDAKKDDREAKEDIDWIKEFVVAIRNFRGEMNISPSEALNILLHNCSRITLLRVKKNKNLLLHLARLKSLSVLSSSYEEGPTSIIKIIEGAELLISIDKKNVLNKKSEAECLTKKIAKLDIEINKLKTKLEQTNFLLRAPTNIIAQERARMIQLEQSKSKLYEQYILLTS